MNDDKKNSMPDLAENMPGRVGEIPAVDDGAIIDAADKVKKAAIKARDEELDDEWKEAKVKAGITGPMPRPEEWKVKDSDYEWIPSYFEPFWSRRMGAATDMADSLKTARGALSSGEVTVIEGSKKAVAQWGGESQQAFHKFFLVPFPNAINNQKAVIDELRAALYIHEGIQRKGREMAKAIADATAKALEPSGGGFSLKSPEAKLTYTMIGVAAWIAATAASAGTVGVLTGTLAGKLTLVGAGSFAAGGIASYEKGGKGPQSVNGTDKSIDGEKVADKLQSMVDRLNELQKDMFEEERSLAHHLDQSTQGVEGVLGSTGLELATLLPNEPEGDGIADISDGEKPPESEFGPPE